MNSICFDFLAYCLDESKEESQEFANIDWKELFDFGKQQAIPAIILSGINRFSKNNRKSLSVSNELLYEWFGLSLMVENQNRLVDQRVIDITNHLRENGFESCILKGQGNAAMYPNPTLRSPGDIDVWLGGTKEEIASFVHKRFPDSVIGDHHMDYPLFKDVEVELHYYPSFCYNYRHNRKLQCFFQKEKKLQFNNNVNGQYSTPTAQFNLVFQLSHMMRHFFTQGIGLRHAVDYYYLLKQDLSEDDKRAVVSVMKDCGMYKFFQALMWIETEILGLGKNTDIAPPHKRAGVLVLHEMIKGGNFGKQYSRWGNKVLAIYAHQLFYNLRYVFEFPVEPISRPFYLLIEYLKRHLFHKN